ncbi:unnamed protein product, partial [Ectocarpus sp. 6 AP-2014]
VLLLLLLLLAFALRKLRSGQWVRVDCSGLFDAAAVAGREEKRGCGDAVAVRWRAPVRRMC